MARGTLKQHVERVENLFDQVCAKVEEEGLVDPPPRSRLKIETKQDQPYVGEFLWHCKRKRMPMRAAHERPLAALG